MIRSITSQKFSVEAGEPVVVPVTPGLTYIVGIAGDTPGVTIQANWVCNGTPCSSPYNTDALTVGVYLLEAISNEMEFISTSDTAFISLHTNPVTTINVGSSTYA
jgi:hypothetical protein